MTCSDFLILGIIEAKRRARVNSLANAVEAIRGGWGRGPEECYRNAVVKAGLGTALERAILNWDIQVSQGWTLSFIAHSAHVTPEVDSQVLARFTQNLLFLGLNWSPKGDLRTSDHVPLACIVFCSEGDS